MSYTRPTQLLWFIGATVFVLALFHSLGENTNSDWIANISSHHLQKLRGMAEYYSSSLLRRQKISGRKRYSNESR